MYIGPCFCCRPLVPYVFCLFISIIVLFIRIKKKQCYLFLLLYAKQNRHTNSTHVLEQLFSMNMTQLAIYLLPCFWLDLSVGGVGNLNILSKVIGYIIPPYLNRITRHIKFYFILYQRIYNTPFTQGRLEPLCIYPHHTKFHLLRQWAYCDP